MSDFDFNKMSFEDFERFISCSRKRAFASQFYVERFAESYYRNNGVQMYFYKCRYCPDWHLTKQPQKEYEV